VRDIYILKSIVIKLFTT